jgi:hypothetical protein
VLVAAGLATPFGCSVPEYPAEPKPTYAGIRRDFDYIAIDGRHLSSTTTRGRPTVLLFITTFDLGSQVAVRRVAEVAHDHVPRINAGAVVLEPPRNVPLVEAFVASTETDFPVALADPATLEARGAFGEVRVVPTTVVLDASGVEVWRKEGAPAIAEIEAALDRKSR